MAVFVAGRMDLSLYALQAVMALASQAVGPLDAVGEAPRQHQPHYSVTTTTVVLRLGTWMGYSTSFASGHVFTSLVSQDKISQC